MRGTACDACLRRSELLALLAPNIARALTEQRKLPALLSLGDRELADAVAGKGRNVVEELLKEFDVQRARRQAENAGLWSVCRHRDGLPSGMLASADAPPLLYVRGEPERLERLAAEPAVAVVGSRRASSYGLEVARALSRELATCGVPVISGMALGVDSAAHEGALAGGGLTLAVQAGGADRAYPASKAALHRRICAEGLVVSELPPGFRPFRWCFPARNRIMAGLSAMTVVVEGTASSGSLITARFAADLGRDVGAVPGQVTSALAAGPNGLIADGACVVRSAVDVLDVLFGPGLGPGFGPGREGNVVARDPARNLEPRLAALLAAVESGRGAVDSIASRPDEVAGVLAGLTELEMMGLITRAAGGRYIRCA